MADLRISELAALAGANLDAADLLPVVDVSASETKKITIEDAIGYGVTLIADATIPGAKIVFNSGTIPGSALVSNAVDTAQLADDGVTAAKLADQSTVDLVTTLPAFGVYVGQLALDTDDNKVYCWDGSSWVSFKAAGSINAVIGDTAGIVNLNVVTSGDTVTITATLDNTSGAAQFFAGPTAGSGPVSYRQIASGDLPTAGSGGKGAVSVSGQGLAVSGDQLVIDNTVAASGTTYSVVQYSTKGLVTAGRAITSADLPAATSVDKGAVIPGTGLAAAAGGALNHSNAVASGTATKVAYDAQGHITAAQALLDTDIPSLPASKITSGTLGVSLFGTNSITGVKLADSSTVKFGGASSTAGVVTFPTADFRGQQFFDALNGDLYLYDGAAWQPITITAGELIYAGTYNANLNQVKSVTAAGTAAGLTVSNALPAASSSNLRYYVVVSDSGTGSAPAPVVALAPPDMLVSSGTAWELIDVSNGIAGQLASNITFTPSGSIASTNVQTAIQELDSEKISAAGATITGNLEIGSAGSLTWEGSTADAYETTLTVVDPTADRTITLPNVTGTVVTTGDSGTVTSTMIADGAIVNDDINASAAIVDTKLAIISTAGKVSNSATTAASANTASAIVARDGSGNFTAGTITASLTGAASLNVLKTGDTMSGALGVPLGTFSAPAVYPGTDTDTGLYSPGANQIALGTNGAQRLAIDSSGQTLIGPGTARGVGGGVVSTFAVESLGQAASFVRNSLDTSGAIIALGKSRGTAAGAITAVQAEDILGEIRFAGANGSDLTSIGAHIRAIVDGQVGTSGDLSDMPSRLVFSTTPDGESTATERVRIGAAGQIGLSGANYGTNGQVLTSAGSAAAPTWTTISAGGSGDVVLASNNAFTGANTFTNTTGQIFRPAATQDGILLRGRAGGTTSRTVEIIPATLTASRVLTAPDVTGTIVTTGDTSSVTNTMLAGTIADSKLNTISTAGKVSNSATTATSADTASTIVARDASNGFSAGAITAANINVDSAAAIPSNGIYLAATNSPAFTSASTERFRLNSSGDLLFGQSTTASPGAGNTTTGAAIEAANDALYLSRASSGLNLSLNNNTASGTVSCVDMRRSGAVVGQITTTTTSTAYVTSSDYRLKENIVPVVNAVTRLQQLSPSRFNFISDPGTVVDGFIAHEAAAVVPECVVGAKDAVDSNGNPVYQGIDQSKLVPLLTAALQEAIAKIETLEVSSADLIARITALEAI